MGTCATRDRLTKHNHLLKNKQLNRNNFTIIPLFKIQDNTVNYIDITTNIQTIKIIKIAIIITLQKYFWESDGRRF